MEKRILILTAGFGEGHNSAARGMRDGLAVVSGGTATVEMHDIFSETFGFANDWARQGYLAMINRTPRAWGWFYRKLDGRDNYAAQMGWLFMAKSRLSQLLVRFQPTAVVSVYPAYPHILGTILGGAPASFRQVVCITDSITVNAIWFRCASDLFLVPNEQTAAVLAAAGLPGEKVRVTGFPVTPKFAELGELRQSPVTGGERRILYMINAGGRAAPEIIRGLSRLPNVRLTVTVGRDERLRRTVEDVNAELERKFEIVGWSDQLPRLMLESHLLISKAGGATVQETIAAKCPMIVSQIVPGQEEGNARLIEESRSGLVATTPATIIGAVERGFADDARLWREWSANISRISRPKAPLEIAELLLSL
ncbi:MAG TPA: glycosyltransferase [Chthoniobacterales bacterium]|jgi:processive 1,2-diacylglycerol beta-glucosyltransferase